MASTDHLDDARDDDRDRAHDRDDDAYRPVRGWQVLWRGGFATWHRGHEYVVDVDFLDWDERIRLYRDGRLVDEQRRRAAFDLPGGAVVEARLSTYGMRYVRLVDGDGVRDLDPLPGTAEAWRDRLHADHPGASRALGAVSWTVLVVALLTQVPQLLGVLSGFTGWDPPVLELPAAVNTVLSVGGVAAAVERALRRRYHPLLDD
ncbi:hypothetical protein [Cellulosimicrobium cellulans]|uniref:hypothetical protein n=1 Tax=Cellulosimicrobium cellulans TaxID=1710 RepID=UPI0009F36444|nr:hypothetical protein [Cellulosimicrobium cellulans]